MINRVNGLTIGLTIDESKLPKRHFLPSDEKQFSPNDKNYFIIANKETNKAEIQEMAKLLSESKLPVASFWGIED